MSTLSARRALIDNLIVHRRGRIANTAGDSILAEFASVVDVVSCAVEIQTAMDRVNQPGSSFAMRFRVGINVGDVMVKDGDIFGDGVNVAARLQNLADGGGICVSRGVRDHLRNRVNFLCEDLGEQLVKNIAHPIRAYRLRMGEAQRESDGSGEPSEVALPVEKKRLTRFRVHRGLLLLARRLIVGIGGSTGALDARSAFINVMCTAAGKF